MGFSCTHEKRYFIGRYLILGVWPHACFLFKQHLSWRKEKEIKIWIIIRATVSWLWTVLACGPCWGLIGKLVSWHDLQIKKIIKKKKFFAGLSIKKPTEVWSIMLWALPRPPYLVGRHGPSRLAFCRPWHSMVDGPLTFPFSVQSN